MPIAIAFTVTAALAMVGLIYIQRELTLNFMAVQRRNGLSIEASWMLVVLVGIISSTNALLLIEGERLAYVGPNDAGRTPDRARD